MKIPDAYFDGGFGQRVARPQGAVMPNPSGAEAIGRAGRQLGAAVAGLGLQDLQEQSHNELAAAQERKNEAERLMREQDAELKRMAELREHSAAKAAYFGLENSLAALHQDLVDDPDVNPVDYPTEFKKRAAELVEPMRQKLNEMQWLTIGPDVENRIGHGTVEIFKTGQKEIQDEAWAEDLRAADLLLNDPTKTARQKVQIIMDPDFFAESGRPDHEIEAKRQIYVGKAIENEVVTALNNTKGDVPALQQFRDTLRSQGQDGQYSYMPEMDIKDRERYIDQAQSAIRAAEAERKRQEAEAKRGRMDAARAAHEIYKTAKEGLQPLSAGEENTLLRQMQGTPYYDSAKRIQKNTTSFGFAMEKIKQDPLTFGSATLGLTIPPLDPRNTAAWPQQLQQRGAVAGTIKQKYGLSYLPMLTNQEAKGLVEFMGAQSPRGMVQTVSSLSTLPGMKGDTMNRISQQIAAADSSLGMVFGLAANGRDDAAFHVANGLQIIKGKSAPELKAQGGAAEIRARFDTNLRDAVSDNPRMRESLLTATQAAYLSMAAAKGKSDVSLDRETFDQAFRSVVGNVTKINGKSVVLPSGVPEGSFKDFFKNVSAATVETGGGVRGFKMPADAAAAIRSNGQLYEAGTGRYRVAIGGKFLQTPDGRDFILSLGSHF
jgi:hypothetical protein